MFHILGQASLIEKQFNFGFNQKVIVFSCRKFVWPENSFDSLKLQFTNFSGHKFVKHLVGKCSRTLRMLKFRPTYPPKCFTFLWPEKLVNRSFREPNNVNQSFIESNTNQHNTKTIIFWLKPNLNCVFRQTSLHQNVKHLVGQVGWLSCKLRLNYWLFVWADQKLLELHISSSFKLHTIM